MIFAGIKGVVVAGKGYAAEAAPAESTPAPTFKAAIYEPPHYDEASDPEFMGYSEIAHPAPPLEADVKIIAQTLSGEAEVVNSTMRRAAVVWVILNRVDSNDPYYPDTIREVIIQPFQFAGYSPDNPTTTRNEEIARDVLERWEREKAGERDVGRVLPKDYLFFTGDGKENYFRREFRGAGLWGWKLENPYKN